jgi:hypothetical protein
VALLLWWDGFVLAFALTCAIEIPVYLLSFVALGWVRSHRRPDAPLSGGSAVALGLGVNLLSHPAFWALAHWLAGPGVVIGGELAVVTVEGLVVLAVVRRRPLACLAVSLLANAMSAVVGSALLPMVIDRLASGVSS